MGFIGWGVGRSCWQLALIHQTYGHPCMCDRHLTKTQFVQSTGWSIHIAPTYCRVGRVIQCVARRCLKWKGVGQQGYRIRCVWSSCLRRQLGSLDTCHSKKHHSHSFHRVNKQLADWDSFTRPYFRLLSHLCEMVIFLWGSPLCGLLLSCHQLH